MIGRIERFVTWGDWPAESPPPAGVSAYPMVMAADRWEHLGDVTRAVEDAEAYFASLRGRAGDRPAEETYLCLRFFADRIGEEITLDALWPYWAVAGDTLAKLIARHYRGRTLGGVIIHSEAGKRQRELRDQRLEAALIAKLRRWLPGTLITGYGVHHAASSEPSMSNGYGLLWEAQEGYERADARRSLGEALDMPTVPWLIRCGEIRRVRSLSSEPAGERTVTIADLTAQLVLAAEAGCKTALLWGHQSQTPAAWDRTWAAVANVTRAADHWWAS